MSFETIKEKLKHLPEDSGIYMMKDFRGTIIYVGKAKVLKNRVRSYFVAVDTKDIKTQTLVREIKDFEVIITKTEGDAILLERTLIRHHHPRYNVMLKDGKEYPYIRVNFAEDWPRIEKVRRRDDDGAFYLGPFSNAGSLNTSLKLAGRIFPLIRCSRYEFKTVKRPCNYYHMKMCLGPCKLPTDRDDYVLMIRNALAFLMGKNRDVALDLRQKMQAASDEEKFEAAALYRDQLMALEEVSKRQTVVVKDLDDADAVAYYCGGDQTAFCVLMVREGRIIGNDTFMVDTPLPNEDEILESFLLQYYDNRVLPRELVLQKTTEGLATLLPTLGPREISKPDYETRVMTGQRGSRRDLTEMALKNATYHYEEATRVQSAHQAELERLQVLLRLPALPSRIECIDISNLQGTSIVASDVCFIDGRAAKDQYRHYIIKTLAEGEQNDFASIEEVVRRRLSRGEKEQNLPDLLVIDGGKGQLNAAMKAVREFPNVKLNIVGLAKSRADQNQADKVGRVQHSYERVFIPHEELAIPLKPGSSEFRLLTRIRDEAHRFAIQHHRRRRAKKFTSSPLDDIAGIGPVLKTRLLETFGSVKQLRQASMDELLRVKGMNEKIATMVLASLKG